MNRKNLDIDTVLDVLNILGFNYIMNHTEDYDELRIPSNNPNIKDTSILFNQFSRNIDEIDIIVDIDDEYNIKSK